MSVWRKKINIAVIRAHNVRALERLVSQTATGSTAAPEREPADTRLDRNTNRINVKIATINAAGEIIIKQPAAVATPFPPFLNFV